MAHRDRPRPLPDGATCTACGAPVPTGRMRVLARRDGLAFIERSCPCCGNAALGLLMAPVTPGGEPLIDVAADAAMSGTAHDPAITLPISQADIDAIRADLAAWQGDLVGWLAR